MVAAAASFVALASPVRSELGGIAERDDIEQTENLWAWPTEVVDSANYGIHSPTTVWNPEIGKWYDCCSVNGYVAGQQWRKWQDAGEAYADAVETAVVAGGYTYGVFLGLEPGEYSLTCLTDARARFWVSFYEEVEGGYRWLGNDKLPVGNPLGGAYSGIFLVPDEAVLTLLLPRPYSSTATLTTTDLAIHRID